jgi:hypothetical protein
MISYRAQLSELETGIESQRVPAHPTGLPRPILAATPSQVKEKNQLNGTGVAGDAARRRGGNSAWPSLFTVHDTLFFVTLACLATSLNRVGKLAHRLRLSYAVAIPSLVRRMRTASTVRPVRSAGRPDHREECRVTPGPRAPSVVRDNQGSNAGPDSVRSRPGVGARARLA